MALTHLKKLEAESIHIFREIVAETDNPVMLYSTDKRKFIVAETPGCEHYAGNLVTGASTADIAIVILDARKVISQHTRRHSYLVALLGIRKIVVAINKMDLVGYDEAVFERMVADYREVAERIGIEDVTFIPMSALRGDNVVDKSDSMPWYTGPELMDFLENVSLDGQMQAQPFRLPIQWVNRPNLDFRGFAGMLTGGQIQVGDRVRVQPSGKTSTVARIVTFDGDLLQADAGQSVTITLQDDVDVSRGDIISSVEAPPEIADQFEVNVVWMHEDALLPGRPYLMKLGCNTVNASVTSIKHQVNVNTLEHVAARTLELNAIGVCNISLDRPLAFDPYSRNREMGGFILIDRMTNNTVGAGMIRFALRRAHNIHLQHVDVDKAARSSNKGQKPCVLWFTGLSGSGKSTIANLVEKKLHAMGRHTYLLDGDNVRHGLNKDLGFTDVDRVENIRRVAEVAKLMVDAGLIVLTAFISPFLSERRMARELLAPGEFFEIFVDTPLAVAEARDPKGLYKKARRGELRNFTGIDSPYEVPDRPELLLQSCNRTAEQLAEQVIAMLREKELV